ncbi:MAG: putative toxin-antitoxin system toxin component, PIN family [Candidatus Woesearchaeota archaeon]
MRVVLDTNILVSATLWNGSVAQKLLLKLLEENVSIYISKDIILEYENVLIRDFKYSKSEVETIVNTILKFSILITPKEHVHIVKNDLTDDKIIDCAIEASAEYIITYDKHLLNMTAFRQIKILTPNEIRKQIYP